MSLIPRLVLVATAVAGLGLAAAAPVTEARAAEARAATAPATPQIALSKAYSAAVMQRPTSMLEGWRNSDPVFFTQVGRMGQHPIVATKGGFTVKRGGEIIGGLGVSGGSPDEDQKIAEGVLRDNGFELEFPEWAGNSKPH